MELIDICKTEEVLSLDQNLSSDTKIPLAIYQLPVRRSKEFLDIDSNSYSEIIGCMVNIPSNRYSLGENFSISSFFDIG